MKAATKLDSALSERRSPRANGALLVALSALAALAGCAKSGKDDYLVVHGNLEMTEVQVAFKTPGRIAELAVEEGDEVHKGQLLARLDTEQLMRQRERETAALRLAENALVQARTALRHQRESLAGELALREAEARAAAAILQQLLAGSRPQEIEQARAAMDEARTRNERAQRDWQRAQTLFERDDISAAQYDMFRAAAEAAAAELRRAQEKFALVKEGPRREEIAAARAQMERAQAAVKLAEAGRIELERRELEIAAREAEVDRARAQIAVLDQQIADGTVVAPVSGTVLVKAAEQGEVVAAGTSILTIGDLARPWVRAYVAETDLARVRLGDEAQLTTDSYPGKTYRGVITFIASEAEFTPKTIQTAEERVKLVYRIKISAPNPNGELKLNMPVDARIRLRAR